ncbi:hypothetical protein CTRI78_v000677 [Colletotrichum trifolii]|uniref:Uncharacterized protein n=1 Tax=Colletotrichum trifolii TaxID=5466 RepID=A0A4R8RS77_COLTR|nr:hypothetical protein CTRI78_v000677 [Colletotrichum trifolii]
MSGTSPFDSGDLLSSPPNHFTKPTGKREAPVTKAEKYVDRGAQRAMPCSPCVYRLIANPEAELCMDRKAALNVLMKASPALSL